MAIDSQEVIRLLDRLEVFRQCGSGGAFIRLDPDDNYGARQLGDNPFWRGKDLKTEYPSKEAFRTEPQKIGQALAIAAAERGLDSQQFDKLAVGGWKYLRADALIVHCQSLRTQLTIEQDDAFAADVRNLAKCLEIDRGHLSVHTIEVAKTLSAKIEGLSAAASPEVEHLLQGLSNACRDITFYGQPAPLLMAAQSDAKRGRSKLPDVPTPEYLRGLADVLSPRPVDGGGGASPPPSQRATVNQRMAEILLTNQECIGWSRYEWSQRLDRSESAVQGTATWKRIMTLRTAEKLTHAKPNDRRRK